MYGGDIKGTGSQGGLPPLTPFFSSFSYLQSFINFLVFYFLLLIRGLDIRIFSLLLLSLYLCSSFVIGTETRLGAYFTNWAQYRPGAGSCKPDNTASILSKVTDLNYAFLFFNYSPSTIDREIIFPYLSLPVKKILL